MGEIMFNIPSKREDLLKEATSDYSVSNVYVKGELLTKLQEARIVLKDEGPNYILENFDVYYSVLHHSDRISEDIILKAFQDLEKAVNELANNLRFLLEDKSSITDELKRKTINTITMLLYIYLQTATYIDQKQNEELILKDKTKQKKAVSNINKSKLIMTINNIIQQEINVFWVPALIDETFINMIADVCYQFLKNPAIKNEKELNNNIFGLFGNLIKMHNYCKTFVFFIIHYIRSSEHLANLVPEGIKFIIEQFHCNEIVHYLIKEATEWQGQENYEDQQGTRYCSLFITNLGVLMPTLILPELEYLNEYLSSDPPILRISVLNLFTQVILDVLTKHEMSDLEKENRDDLFATLMEHLLDTNSTVRSKVIQNLAKLQKENAIPLTLQEKVLEKVIRHLSDKAAAARKAAINCITVFISYNSFGGNLQLSKIKEELANKTELLNKMEADFKELQMKKIEEKKEIWVNIQERLREIITTELENTENDTEENTDEQPNEDNSDSENNMKGIVQMYLKEDKLLEAFKLCRTIIHKDIEKMEKKPENEADIYLFMLQTIFMDISLYKDALRIEFGFSAEDLEKIKALETKIAYYENTIKFLTLIDSALGPMKELLFTTTVSDMHEAIKFFTTAFHFSIDNISDGVLAMLNLMKQKEQDRKEAVVAAFKEMYLNTNSKNLMEHTVTIIDRLIALLDELPVENENDFQDIVSNWADKKVLDNSIIDTLWKYFTKSLPVTDLQSRTATELLRIAALGRKTIIMKNINIVATVAFNERGRKDMVFLANSCKLLAVAGREKIDINSEEPAFKLSHNDQLFEDLIKILVETFFEPVQYYSAALQAAIDFIYRVCNKPTAVCERIFYGIFTKLQQDYSDKGEYENFFIDRIANLLGNVALKQLTFLDDTVYRELKRRHFVRELKNDNKTPSAKKARKSTKGRLSGVSINTTESSIINRTNRDDTVLEGAQAEDTDAEFILNTLEQHILAPSTLLGHFVKFLINICERSDIYSDVIIQGTAVTALMRYMLMSSKFCKDNIRLIFTILDKTTHDDVKRTILVHCSDLLTRFPNIVEPWMSKIYETLKDKSVRVRKIAFFVISTLILRDMIRAHSHISEMAICLIDDEEEISQLCNRFFLQLVQKENNLDNILPDIFSHLIKVEEMSETNLRYILKFLFEQIDNTKKVENLVDRFCSKFCLANDDSKIIRNVAFCLSLINYNEKALRKLQEKFPTYKHLLHEQEVHTFLKQILSQCNKQKGVGKTDLKPIVAEIEASIQQMLEVNNENDPSNQTRRMRPPKSAPPKRNKKKTPASKKKTRRTNSSDSDDEKSSSPAVTPKRRTRRSRLSDLN